MKDLYSKITAVNVVSPVVGSNGSAPAAVSDVDLAGYNSALILFSLGLESGTLSGSLYWTLKLEHADDDGTGAAGSYADVAAKDVLGVTPASGIICTVDAPAEDEKVYKIGYVGGKRFLKFTIAETGTPSGCPMTIILLKGAPQDAPAA